MFKSTLALVAALMLMLTAAAQDTEPAPLQIGVGVAQTSNAALFGQDQVIGARIAAEYFNARGGVNGRPIEIVVQDTGGDEAGAINAFQNLISADVLAILGPSLSQQAFAANPLAEQAGIPVLGPSNLARGIPEIGRFIGRISAPATAQVPFAVDAALTLNPDIQDVAVFYAQNDAFSSSETTFFQEEVTARGLNLTSVQTFQTTDTDFSTQITNALADNPQLIIVSGLAVDGGNVVRQLREFGYEGLIVGGNGLNTPNIFPVCQAACDGLIATQAYSADADLEINRELLAIYQEEQGTTPSQFVAQAFAGIQVYVESLIKVDDIYGLETLTNDQIRLALNTVLLNGTYETPMGTVSFTPLGEVVQERFYVAQVQMNDDGQTGRFVFIEN